MGRAEWETPQQQAIRRKNRIRLAIVGPIAIIAVAIAIIAYMRDPEQSGPAPATHVAAAFHGQWRGVADNGRDTFDVVLTFDETSGANTATSSSTDRASGIRCERHEVVTASTDTELTLQADTATGGEGCDPGTKSTVQLHTDGSLDYRSPARDGAITGTLRKG